MFYDDKNNNYGGRYRALIGDKKIEEYGININCGKSFVKGMYPKWNIHFENTGMDNNEIVADLEYKSTKQPIWIFKNTGNNVSTSRLGYYFIMNCDAIQLFDKYFNTFKCPL